MIFKRPISNSLSPNTQKDDVLLAKQLLSGSAQVILPNGEKEALKGKRMALEAYFCTQYGHNKAFALNSGRGALLAILLALNLPKGSGIGVQAFTCNAVINPIIKAGYKPVYIDIDDDLNLDISLFRQNASKLGAIIVQHTFGMPAKIEEICAFAKERNIFVIEDCAHALGIKNSSGKLLGSFGDAAFWSFGRDKMVSCVFGGVAVVKNLQMEAKISAYYANCSEPPKSWTWQQLRHPVLFENVVLPFYDFLGLGKKFLSLYLKTGKLGRAVEKRECLGQWNEVFPSLLPDELAVLAMHQLEKLQSYNSHRSELSAIYVRKLQDNLKFALPFIEAKDNPHPFMRFPIIVNDRSAVLKQFAKQGIYLDDGWGGKNIVPAQTELINMGYELDSCPKAQTVAKRIINLPTNINTSSEDALKIANYLI